MNTSCEFVYFSTYLPYSFLHLAHLSSLWIPYLMKNVAGCRLLAASPGHLSPIARSFVTNTFLTMSRLLTTNIYCLSHNTNVFIILILMTCVTSTVLILVCHCLWLTILFIVNLEIFVGCDGLLSFIFLCGMIRFLICFCSVCLCLNFMLSVFVTNKRTYNTLDASQCEWH